MVPGIDGINRMKREKIQNKRTGRGGAGGVTLRELKIEKVKRNRVFISGPITGKVNYKEHFDQVQLLLEAQNYDVINPAHLIEVYPNGTHEDYMEMCLWLIDKADMICMINGWEESPGANREYGFALGLDKQIINEEIARARV